MELNIACLVFSEGKKEAEMGKKAPNPRVFFDISIGGEPAGKMVMEVSKHLSFCHSVPFFSLTFLSSSLNIVVAVIKSPGLPLLPH